MPEKIEYRELTKNQFKRLKKSTRLISYHISEISKKYGYTEFASSEDWIGFSYSKNKRVRRYFVFELSNETKELFNLRIGAWLMKGEKVERFLDKQMASDLPLEQFGSNDFRLFESAISEAESINIEDLKSV